MSEDAPEYAGIKPEERSFRRSDGYYFGDRKLEPFSFVRQSALLALIEAMGSSSLVQVAAATWLLTQPDAVAHKVRRKPDSFVKDVDAFANTNGIVIGGSGLTPATALYEAITTDNRDSAVVPDLGGNDEEDEPDPN